MKKSELRKIIKEEIGNNSGNFYALVKNDRNKMFCLPKTHAPKVVNKQSWVFFGPPKTTCPKRCEKKVLGIFWTPKNTWQKSNEKMVAGDQAQT